MLSCGLIQVDIVAGGEYSSITPPCGFCQRVRPAPGLDNDILRGIGLQYFIPSHHDFLVAGDDLLNSGGEQRLKCYAILDRMYPHELLNARIRLPCLEVAFISSCVEIGIREQS